MNKITSWFLVAILLLAPAIAIAQVPVPAPAPIPGFDTSATPAAAGITLPADMEVSGDEGFVNIKATCKGSVKWLVIYNGKLKYVINDATNSIIVAVPCQGGTFSVFAVGLVDGKLTEFVRTNVKVNVPTMFPTGPHPTPAGGLHVTFILDLNNATPEMAALLNSPTLKKAITDKGDYFRIYDSKSPIVSQKKLDQVMARVGNAAMIVQDGTGHPLVAQPIPKTETEVMTILNKLGK